MAELDLALFRVLTAVVSVAGLAVLQVDSCLDHSVSPSAGQAVFTDTLSSPSASDSSPLIPTF